MGAVFYLHLRCARTRLGTCPLLFGFFCCFFKRKIHPSSFNFSLLGSSFDSILTFYIYFFVFLSTLLSHLQQTARACMKRQCWHPGMNMLALNCTGSLLMLWITWCLLLFSIHKFILPNETSHSCTVLTPLCLSLYCLFLLLLLQHTKDYATPFFCLWLRLRASALFRQTQNEVTHKVFTLLLGLYGQRVCFFPLCFSTFSYFERK